MSKKYLTKLDKAKDNIFRIEDILKDLRKYKEVDNDKILLFEKLLASYKEKYEKYSKNNEPYFEYQSYEYYKNIFSNREGYELYVYFTSEVNSILEEDISPYKKEKILQNASKAFKEREDEIEKELLGD